MDGFARSGRRGPNHSHRKDEAMTHRERYTAAVSHCTPDRAPFDLGATALTAMNEQFIDKMADFCGIRADSRQQAVEAIQTRYGVDFRGVGDVLNPHGVLADDSNRSRGQFTNSWGITYAYSGMYWEITGNPLKDATFQQVKAFPWPDASGIDRDHIKALTDRTRRLYEDTDYVVVAGHPVYGYLELGCWMFGFDDFLYRLLGEPETVEWFFERYHRYVLDVNELYYGSLGPYIHLTTSGDDFGTQKGPFLSPGLFERSIAPWYKKRIEHVKSICDIDYFHHSCGSVYRLMDSIIAMGVDILNPIQPGAAEMEPERLKSEYGDRMVFWGGIDEQNLLTHAAPDEVRREVRRVCDIMSSGGGYILSASHNIQPDVPPENIDAMLRALNEG